MAIQKYKNGFLEIPENILVTKEGNVIDKRDNSILSTIKIGRDNGIIVDDKTYLIKDLVYSIHGEKCNYNHFVGHKNRKPNDMNVDDIRNLEAITWRRWYGWESNDIRYTDRELNKIIDNYKKYSFLLNIKEQILKDDDEHISLSEVLISMLEIFKSLNKNTNIEHMRTFIFSFKDTKNLLFSETIFNFILIFFEDDIKILREIFMHMKIDDDLSRLFDGEDEYKNYKPSDDFKGITLLHA